MEDTLLPGRGRADRVVEGERTVEDAAADLAPVGHLAKSGRVERRGQVWIDRLDRGKDGDLGRGDADDMREIDRIANDVGFVLQRRYYVDGRIGDEDRKRHSLNSSP